MIGKILSHFCMLSVAQIAVGHEYLNATNSWVVLQGFDWNAIGNRGSLYSTLASQAGAIHSAGFDAVWMPPPSQSVDKEGYLPQEWYKLESESNQLSAVSAIKSTGMSPIADVVVNHRTAPSVNSCTGKYIVFKNPDMVSYTA
jgi:hypothetical protein